MVIIALILVPSDDGPSRLPSPCSPIDFRNYRASPTPPPSPTPASTGRPTAVKRGRQPESTSGEDIDDDDYVPSRRVSAGRKHKRGSAVGSTRHGGRPRPRRTKRPRIKEEEAEDIDCHVEDVGNDGGHDKPFRLDIVTCQWQGCGQTVKRLYIVRHIEKTHLATRKDEDSGDKKCKIECLWAHGRKLHTIERDSLRQHIHSAIGTAYLCRCFCWTTKAAIKKKAQILKDTRSGKKLKKARKADEKAPVQPQLDAEKVWGPCLALYSQLWRLNGHIKGTHKGEDYRQTSASAMLLD